MELSKVHNPTIRKGATMIQIRTETQEDQQAIREVNTQAFGRKNEADLVDAIRASENFIPALSLVALNAKEIVGHILFSQIAIETEQDEVGVLGLAPMAVKPEYQNQGIGSELVKQGLQACQNTDYPAVVVLGHPEFYPRFGFSPARSQGIVPPFEVGDEYFMVTKLHPGEWKKISGKVKYPSTFDQL